MEMGYNWYVRMPDEKAVDERAVLKNLYGAPGSVIVYDCSGLNGEPVLSDVLEAADVIYLVIDPLPTRLLEGRAFMEDLRSRFPETELVVNKFAKGIHRGELAAFLGTSAYHKLDAVSFEDIYRAEYNCRLI